MQTIKLNSESIFNLGPIPITNGILALWISMLLIILFAFLVKRKINIIPTKLQVVAESIYEFFYEKMLDAFGTEKLAKRFMPYILTIFILFLVANQFSIIPLITSMTSGETSLFKTPTGDFSLPIAVALMTVGISNIMALSIAPIRHVGNFIKIQELFKIRKLSDIPNAFLEIFLGLLDIIGEIAKVVSLSARLFGNVIAGELMVIIMTSLASFIVPMPFIFLSIFSGVIQAFVFPLLSMQYIAGSIQGVQKEEANA